MNAWIQNLLIVVAAFLSMECVAWLTHKYLMHGIFWFLHRDHHTRENQSFFEKNDYFFLIFATPGIIFLYLGVHNFNYIFWIGTGITFYGFAYFLVHDVFIHQRFKIFRKAESPYLKAIKRAHKMHHKHLNKQEGECFGMLWVPMKYFKDASKS